MLQFEKFEKKKSFGIRQNMIPNRFEKSDPQPVLRIRDVYPGSRIRIFPHPGSRIPDLGSRIPDPTKQEEVKQFF